MPGHCGLGWAGGKDPIVAESISRWHLSLSTVPSAVSREGRRAVPIPARTWESKSSK